MSRLTEKLVEHDHGECVSGEYHFPEYTNGCWGQPSRPRCWICKIRAPIKILKLAQDIRKRD